MVFSMNHFPLGELKPNCYRYGITELKIEKNGLQNSAEPVATTSL